MEFIKKKPLIIRTHSAKTVDLEKMIKSNDRIMRLYKRKSPCYENGGCAKMMEQGRCSQKDVETCYKSLDTLMK